MNGLRGLKERNDAGKMPKRCRKNASFEFPCKIFAENAILYPEGSEYVFDYRIRKSGTRLCEYQT